MSPVGRKKKKERKKNLEKFDAISVCFKEPGREIYRNRYIKIRRFKKNIKTTMPSLIDIQRGS